MPAAAARNAARRTRARHCETSRRKECERVARRALRTERPACGSPDSARGPPLRRGLRGRAAGRSKGLRPGATRVRARRGLPRRTICWRKVSANAVVSTTTSTPRSVSRCATSCVWISVPPVSGRYRAVTIRTLIGRPRRKVPCPAPRPGCERIRTCQYSGVAPRGKASGLR